MTSDCPDFTGKDQAEDGIISAGPFTSESLAPQRGGSIAYKIWVGSQQPDLQEVTIATFPPDGTAPHRYRRSAGAEAAGVKQFFPGLIDIPLRGTWRFEITGDDHRLCFRVTYPPA